MMPKDRRSVLDIGARDGHFSRLLTRYFIEVTALDLQKPNFEIPGVTTVAGDATKLQFPDDSFDCVFCAEVLEHIPNVETACRELSRVARHELIIGVPFMQDIRVGRTTCPSCRRISPPWGHVNSFDEQRLQQLFPNLRVTSKSFVGTSSDRTNLLSTALMDVGGNPWGTYRDDERCIHCGANLTVPENRPLWQKVCSAVGTRINSVQGRFERPHAAWIHLVMSKAAADTAVEELRPKVTIKPEIQPQKEQHVER